MHQQSFSGLSFIKLSAFIALSWSSLTPVTQAAITKGWNSSYMTPCECDDKFEQAFPAIYANRLDTKNEARFLDLTTDLIEGFTASKEIPNSKKYIYWTVYELGAFDIVNALVAAKKAGVQVFVVTDGKSVVQKPKTESEQMTTQSNMQAWVADRHLLTKEAFKTLGKAKIPVIYSNPEFEPISTPYPPIMHEKIRIFAVKEGKDIVPTFAYVSTHNDTYSETIGDPKTSIQLERLKKGNLTKEELDPRSKGNVQTSFIVRNQELLKVLLENTLDQIEVYKNGKGRIFDLPNKEPLLVTLGDGTTINLSFTYGRRRPTYNPNEHIKNFVGELADLPKDSFQADLHLQQFVFSYGGASDNMKRLMENHSQNVKMNVWVDGNFAFEPYSQARKMAGMYTVLTFRKDMPIDYPWKKTTRQNVDARAYVNSFDKLHTKNSFVEYKRSDMKKPRYRIFTGSINFSSNGVSNKEMFFAIDTASTAFVNTMKAQRSFLENEGYLKPIDDSGLFLRLKSTSKKVAGATFASDELAYQAYANFLNVIEKRRVESLLEGYQIAVKDFFPWDSVKVKWVDSLAEFFSAVGAEKAVEPVTQDVHKNLRQTKRFYPSVASVDILMHLTEQSEALDPGVRQSVLDLFSN
jgi:hypothetical protein